MNIKKKCRHAVRKHGWRKITMMAGAVLGLVVMLALVLPAASLAKGLGLTLGIAGLGLGAAIENITETSTPDDHKVRDVAEDLTWLRPDIYPMDTILRRMEVKRGMKKAKQVKVEWEEDDIIPRTDTANGGETAGSAGASVDVTVATVANWRKDDLIYLPDNATAPGAVLYVSAIAGNDLTVYRVVAGTTFGTVPAIANGETLVRLANAKEEHGYASLSRTTMPVQYFNYPQIFDTVVAISGTRMATENYTEDDYSRSEKQVLYDYRSGLEYATIFGKRAKVADPTTGKQRTFMGGITSFLSTNDITYTTGSLTESILIDWCKQVFTGNAGSKIRLMFTTPNLTAEIDKILITSGSLQSFRDEKVLGVSATRIHSSFGDIMLINHQGMAEMGKSNYGLLIDPKHIRRRPLRPMFRKDVQAPNIDGQAEQWLEEVTTEVRYELTHAVMRDSATDGFD